MKSFLTVLVAVLLFIASPFDVKGLVPSAGKEIRNSYSNDVSFRQHENPSRRAFVQSTAAAFLSGAVGSIASTQPAAAATLSPKAKDLIAELQECKTKLEPIPQLLQDMEWEKVRAILKVPPVNKLWNLGDSKNPVMQLAQDLGNVEFFELKDDLAYSLQICDQLTYDNAFVYFQPGNGKYKIKEPQDLAKKAMQQIQQIVDLANEL